MPDAQAPDAEMVLLARIMARAGRTTGAQYFKSLCASLCDELGCHLAGVASLDPLSHDLGWRCLRVGDEEQDPPPQGSRLTRSPLIAQDLTLEGDALARWVSTDPVLAPLPLRRLTIRPLIGQDNQVLGAIVLGETSTAIRPPGHDAVMRVLADRAAAELQHSDDAARLRESEAQVAHLQGLDLVGLLASGVAHDFNNLLTVIDGHAAMLGHEIDDQGVAAEHLLAVQQATRRAVGLSRELLSLSKRGEGQAGRCDVGKALEAVVRLAQPSLGTGRRLQVAWSQDLPQVALALIRLEQVLLNLVLNARDALGPVGHVLLVAEAITPQAAAVHGLRFDEGVHLRVVDDGSGMEPDVLAQCLTPFFTTKGEGGTGLGLDTCRDLVRRAGGRLWIESTPGQGTIVHIALPAADLAPLEVVTPLPEPDTQVVLRQVRLMLDKVDGDDPTRT